MDTIWQWVCGHPWWTFFIFLGAWTHFFRGASTADTGKALYFVIYAMQTDLYCGGRLWRLRKLARRRGLTDGQLLDVMLDKYEVIIGEIEIPEKATSADIASQNRWKPPQ